MERSYSSSATGTADNRANSLREEVEAMLCPICLELMNEPVTLAPCGHALCNGCVKAHTKHAINQSKCPVCRSRIASTAKNLQLASILHSYANSQQETHPHSDVDISKLRSELARTEAREKHLAGELPRVQQEEDNAKRNVHSAGVVLNQLQDDEADAQAKVDEARRILTLVKEQVKEQEHKISELEKTREQASSRRSLLQHSLEELTTKRRKLRVLLTASEEEEGR